MKVLILLLIVAIVFFSCKKDSQQNQEWIIGDWHPVYGLYTPDNQQGFRFEDKSKCINKVGFYSYFYSNGIRLDHCGEAFIDSAYFCDFHMKYEHPLDYDPYLFNVNRAYGNKTSYKIEKDTLQIFDLAKQDWQKYHLSFKGRDTLKLSYLHDGYKKEWVDWFIRKSYEEVDEIPLLEQIIFYVPSSCITGEKYLLIRRDGLFFSYGYFKSDEFFIGRMQPEEFRNIENRFKQANILEIIDQRSKRALLALFNSTVTFITTNYQMYTIENPLEIQPHEFQWAYLSGVFLPDFIQEIKPYLKEEYPSLLTEVKDFSNLSIDAGGLFFSERFYLGALLCTAEEVRNIEFENMYMISVNNNDFMQSDGRYFRYTNREGKKITLDIGFNFIEVNR